MGTTTSVGSTYRRLLNEPAVSNPPRRVWRDWALVAFFVAAIVLEGILRTDIPNAVGVFVMCAVLQLGLLWRRTHPLVTLAIVLGTVNGYDLIAKIVGWPVINIFSTASLLILIYAVFRWASGRHMMISALMMVAAVIHGSVGDQSVTEDLIGGFIVISLPAVLGAAIRYMLVARTQQLDQVKANEREQLARELHDSVAHHVSAIAIQAQAGLFVARSSSSLEGATSALEVIEEQASRTLEEMRSMVEVLRDGDRPVDLAPQRGVAQIDQLADVSGADGPAIDVQLTGDLQRLTPPVDTALYRLSQEAITNAIRHAKHATRIDVLIRGSADHVELTVTDDGVGSLASGSGGYGLVGMQERASLLGGSLDAGPAAGQGWVVRARLPRQRPAS